MNINKLFISNVFSELPKFLKSSNFSKAILVGIAVSFPLVLGIQLGHLEIGLAICFGAFWSSPSDIIGSFKHKKIGILISAALVTIISFIGAYLHFETWISLPILGVLSFCIAFISIYGFRASLISFSGLLALVLSFAHKSTELEIYQYALLVGFGGLWYLFLAKIRDSINPKAETEELLFATYKLTANFIETRGKLIGPNGEKKKIEDELQKLQSELIENHKTLREILIQSRKSSGWSNYQDKRLLVFVQLVEMMETAIANPVNYERMDLLFQKHPQNIKLFQELIFEMSKQLRMISEAEILNKNLPENNILEQCFNKIRLEIASLNKNQDLEEYVMFQNLLEYQEKQFKKLKRIKLLLGETNAMELDFVDRNVSKRFLETQDYNPILLLRNFSFKSNIFRHSLRLAVTIMIGYALGSLFPFQNPYWILLTIIIIMRPNYGLTKSRAKDRIIGTLIGGIFAYGMVFLIQGVYVFGVLGLVSMVISLALIQKNSRISTFFVTLSVVFIYAILSPDILTVVKFRIVDTLVGAGLSFMAMLLLWPTWESVGILKSIEKSVRANKDFLHEIIEYYQNKGNVPASYKIARKEAFVETSNLSSAFQRMTQEPKSKQNKMDENYELVVLNHNFLASLASLSTYIQNHKTTAASEKFKLVTDNIEKNMEEVLLCLNDESNKNVKLSQQYNSLFTEQLFVFPTLENGSLAYNDSQSVRDLQEAHLVWEQLQWLLNISGKMLKLTESLKQEY